MKLDEKDIKSIASGRFTKKWRWHFLGSLIFCSFLVVGIGIGVSLLKSAPEWLGNLIFIPIFLMIVGLGLWDWNLRKAEKGLVKEWKSEEGIY